MVFVFMYAKTLKRDLVQRDSTSDKKRSLKQYGYRLVKSSRDNFYQKNIFKTIFLTKKVKRERIYQVLIYKL